MVESQGVEPCDRISTAYRLAIGCITVLPTLLKIGVRYGIRTRISRLLALRHDALTFRPNAHNWWKR